MVDALSAVVAFLLAVFVFRSYINIRQWYRYQRKELNAELQALVTQEDFDKAQAYGFDKLSFNMLGAFYEVLEEVGVLCLGVLPYVWNWSKAVSSQYLWESEYASILVFLGCIQVLSKLTSLPFEVYSTFVIEERHGFNKTSRAEFIKDQIKTMVLGLVLKVAVLYGILAIINWAGPNFCFYVWAFLTVFVLVMSHVYHDWIAPIFNTFTDLEPGPLKEAIEALATKVHFPLTKILVIDGSRRSDHSNAYFFGFWKNKRIVIYDTLLNPEKKVTQEEVLAILAHELGHWQNSHFFKRLGILEVNLFVIFYAFQFVLNNDGLLQAFGFTEPSVFISLIIFTYIYSPVAFVLEIMMIFLSRKHEFEADAFSKKLDYGTSLKSGLIKLFTQNSGNMDPDPLYSTITFSHPPLLERIKHL